MNNSTLNRYNGEILSFAQTPASAKAIFRALAGVKSYRFAMAALLILLGSLGNKASAFTTTYYYPTSVSVGTGGVYCVGSTASSITGTIFTSSSAAVGGTSSTVAWSWYYNTTGATGTLAGATLAYTGTSYVASAAAFTATLPGTSISTTTGGTYYYFLYVTNFGGTTTSPDLYSSVVPVTIGAGTLTGPSVLCVGSSGSFTSTIAGGTWSSSSPGVASITGGGLAVGLSQGVTNIVYTAGGCTSTVSLTVNALPTAITGDSMACPGTTTLLSEFALGGTWSSSNTSVATITSGGLVTGVTPGTTTVDYNNGCGVPASEVITINPYPAAITGPDTVCEAGLTTASITLDDATAGGEWTSSTPSVATAVTATTNTGTITGGVAGTTTISYTVLGCTTTTVITVDPQPTPILGALKECASTSITLSDLITGGTWSSSTTAVAIVDPVSGQVTGLIGGTSVITYANGCGYKTAVDTSIAIPDTIVGRNTACLGTTTTFADDILGGTWSSSNPGTASVLPGSGIVTGLAVGTATITYTIPPGCFVTDSVRILPLPAPINGANRVCVGATITMSDAAAGTWSSAQSYVASTTGTASNIGTVTGVSADTANIIFTNSNGCVTSKTITVNPLPLAITGGITQCGLSVDTVYDATPGGAWSSGTPTVATISSTGIISTLGGGTTTISYKLPTGCAATKVISVNPLPTPVVVYNFAINSFMTDTFYLSYQWYDSLQGLIPGANSFQTAALYNGNYWVVVTDSNGCTAASLPVHYSVSMAGVKNQVSTSLRIYPNPANNVLFIESGVRVHAVISSIDGKMEMEQADAKQMNISNLANGMYFISLYDDGGERLIVQKLIKQ